MTYLSDMRIGDVARIDRINGEDALSVRLMEMGLTSGEEVRVHGAAPLGDPIEIAIRGYRLSLRKSEAARVVVDALA